MWFFLSLWKGSYKLVFLEPPSLGTLHRPRGMVGVGPQCPEPWEGGNMLILGGEDGMGPCLPRPDLIGGDSRAGKMEEETGHGVFELPFSHIGPR